jgi:cyclic beta-1,2-glucan synthetase
VFVRRSDRVGAPDVDVIRTTSRLLVDCDGRSLGRIAQAPFSVREPAEEANQAPVRPRRSERSGLPAFALPWRLLSGLLLPDRPRRRSGAHPIAPVGAPDHPLEFDNGLGGMLPDGRYEIRVAGDTVPPAPWVNVIANRAGGFIVSERGTGFTWARNSHFFRLTEWYNDPVVDPATEAIYLRDEETGEIWCPTPAPVPTDSRYTVRHGPGASTFHHDHGSIASDLRVGLAPDRAIKCAVLRLTNHGGSLRRLGVIAYVEWTVGILREHTQHQLVTSYEPEAGLFARNSFDQEYAGWVGFHAMSEPVKSHTGDRREFLGRNGAVDAPAALLRFAGYEDLLSGTTGAGIDPCSALHAEIELPPGASREIVVLLGGMDDPAAARAAIAELKDPVRANAAIDATVAGWTDRLSQIVVRTPEPSFDAIQNRWALYQTLSCRMWGRSALYQSGGAYGFRDQLQDAMALVYAEPAIAREHLLRSAGRQFVEGDVQHWWHPETGRGIRTRFSDDLVWLPFVADYYVRITGDRSVLDESVPFLTMPELGPGEQERYELPEISPETASVHDHCVRALRRAATVGPNGLPLIGGGDWNDGMNRVGIDGKGESIWLGWFLIATMRGYADRAEERGDRAVAEELRARADRYRAAIEAHGWDGEWYRRAYFDDGTPLGSRETDECRIDSIAQSWSVISGAGDPTRQRAAMESVDRHLVRRDARLIALLDPPFDQMAHDPGYIRGYLPGVRENGAQYTHAALWVVLATALRGEGDRAFELYQMINPLTHAATPDQVGVYKVEPYVVAADVYTARGQLGRGGWTWYTGSASWMYRIGLESILGLTKRGDRLSFRPAVPASWPEFSIVYRQGRTEYRIVVREPARVKPGATEVTLDGRRLDGDEIPLVDDGVPHDVVVAGRHLG